MPKSAKATAAGRVRIIEGITAPLGFYVLGLLIVEGFFVLITSTCGFRQEDRRFVLELGAALFTIVVLVVTLLVWFKPAHLMFDKESILADRGRLLNRPELRPSTANDAATSRESLRRFWKPDGKTPNKRNKTRLEKWMKGNHLSGISLTTFITTDFFGELRRKAIEDLVINSGETDHEKD